MFQTLPQLTICALFVLSCLASPRYASAQTAPAIQQEQIIQQQEQERRFEAERLRQIKPPKKHDEEEKETEMLDEDAPCIPIKKIQFTDAPNEITNTLDQEHYLGCKTLKQIDQLLEEVTHILIEQGLVTTRAYLNPEALNQGTIHITIITGLLEDISITHPSKTLSHHMLLPNKKGKPLNLRDIEQAIDQINRLPSYQARSEIIPGKEIGSSTLAIHTESEFPVKGAVMVDNSGQESTGDRQLDVSVTVDNVLGLYDSWYFNSKRDIERHEDGLKSKSFYGSLSIPYGYWTARWSSSYFDYISTVPSINQNSRLSGNSQTHSTELSRVIHRDQVSKTVISGDFTFKNNRNYIENFLQQSQSRKLSIASLKAQHSRTIFGGVATASASIERGLKLFGALDDDTVISIDDDPAKAQFTKYKADLGYYKPFTLRNAQFVFNTQINSQWSPHTLYSTEQISVGGLHTVRGFRDQSISGDNGLYARNELQWNLPLPKQKPEWIKQAKLHLGYDVGWIRDDASDPREGGTVSGVTLGSDFTIGPSKVKLTWEKALSSPGYINPDAEQIYLQFGFVF